MLCLNTIMVIPFKLQLVLLGVFIFLVWYFVLRKYNSLGLRMFFLFTVIAALACSWLYTDIQDTKSMEKNGELHAAEVIEKAKAKSESSSSPHNQITIAFEQPAGEKYMATTYTYISDEEYNALRIGQTIHVLYNPVNDQTYYTVSFNRYKNDQWFLYAFPAVLFLIGSILGITLRKYKVGIGGGTGAEYVEKDGKIFLDERGNATATNLKHLNIVSKLFQAFR